MNSLVTFLEGLGIAQTTSYQILVEIFISFGYLFCVFIHDMEGGHWAVHVIID